MEELILFNHEDISEFTKGFSEKRAIGKPGAFGQVYKGRIKEGKFPNCPVKVAVKISKERDDYRHRMWKLEIDALSTISHGNVIKLVGYAEADKYFALVYERAEQDLLQYIPSSKVVLDKLLLGLACGLRAIHAAGFVHWDIQLRNILLTKDGTVKIADFGLATRRNEKMEFFHDRRHGVFNPNDTEMAKEKFDVYCFGRVLRELVLKEKDRWSPTKCPRTLLSDRCIKGEPNERPSMDEVVSEIKNIQKNEHIEPESSSKKRKKHSVIFC